MSPLKDSPEFCAIIPPKKKRRSQRGKKKEKKKERKKGKRKISKVGLALMFGDLEGGKLVWLMKIRFGCNSL